MTAQPVLHRILIFAIAIFSIESLTCETSAQAPTSFSLSWVRGPHASSCISTRSLALEIEKLFGRAKFFSASDADVSIEASVVRSIETQKWFVRIVVSNPEGRILGDRELQIAGDDCRVIVEPITVIIALIMDPECRYVKLPKHLALGKTDSAEELLNEISSQPNKPGATNEAEEPIQEESDPSVETLSSTPVDKSDQSARWRMTVSFDTAVNIGLLPHTGFGLGLGLTQFFGDFWPIELRANYYFINTIDIESSGGSVGFQGLLAVTRVCPFNFESFGRVLFCAGFDLGSVFATQENFILHKSDFLVLGGELHSRLLLSLWDGINLSLGSTLIVLSPRTYKYKGRSDQTLDLYTMGPLSGNLTVGMVFDVF